MGNADDDGSDRRFVGYCHASQIVVAPITALWRRGEHFPTVESLTDDVLARLRSEATGLHEASDLVAVRGDACIRGRIFGSATFRGTALAKQSGTEADFVLPTIDHQAPVIEKYLLLPYPLGQRRLRLVGLGGLREVLRALFRRTGSPLSLPRLERWKEEAASELEAALVIQARRKHATDVLVHAFSVQLRALGTVIDAKIAGVGVVRRDTPEAELVPRPEISPNAIMTHAYKGHTAEPIRIVQSPLDRRNRVEFAPLVVDADEGAELVAASIGSDRRDAFLATWTELGVDISVEQLYAIVIENQSAGVVAMNSAVLDRYNGEPITAFQFGLFVDHRGRGWGSIVLVEALERLDYSSVFDRPVPRACITVVDNADEGPFNVCLRCGFRSITEPEWLSRDWRFLEHLPGKLKVAGPSD